MHTDGRDQTSYVSVYVLPSPCWRPLPNVATAISEYAVAAARKYGQAALAGAIRVNGVDAVFNLAQIPLLVRDLRAAAAQVDDPAVASNLIDVAKFVESEGSSGSGEIRYAVFLSQ